MAPRANWKGYLRLSLVTCPVALFPATSESEKVSFNQINKRTGHRIKYQRVDAETGEDVDNEDIVKGYKVDADTYIEVTKDELDNIALELNRTIDIDQFVPRDEIDDLYVVRPYYLVPDGKVGHDAYAVIRETIKATGKVALARVVLTNREHVIALEARDKGLVGLLLRYPYEVRQSGEYFDGIQDVKITKDMLDLAKHIVDQKSGHFDPDNFEDHYETALIDLIMDIAQCRTVIDDGLTREYVFAALALNGVPIVRGHSNRRPPPDHRGSDRSKSTGLGELFGHVCGPVDTGCHPTAPPSRVGRTIRYECGGRGARAHELCGEASRWARSLTARSAPVMAMPMPPSRVSIMTVHQSSLSSPPSIAGIVIVMAMAAPPAINHVSHRRDAAAGAIGWSGRPQANQAPSPNTATGIRANWATRIAAMATVPTTARMTIRFIGDSHLMRGGMGRVDASSRIRHSERASWRRRSISSRTISTPKPRRNWDG